MWHILQQLQEILRVFTQVYVNPRNLKGGIRSLLDPCVKAMGGWPFRRSHMEVSNCTSGFGAII